MDSHRDSGLLLAFSSLTSFSFANSLPPYPSLVSVPFSSSCFTFSFQPFPSLWSWRSVRLVFTAILHGSLLLFVAGSTTGCFNIFWSNNRKIRALDIQSKINTWNNVTKKSTSSQLKRKLKCFVSRSTKIVNTHWERILNVCKSSWSACMEVKWDVDIYYRPIAAKLTPQILRPEHRK